MIQFIHLTLAKSDLPYHEIFVRPDFITTISPAPHDEEGANAWISVPGSSFRVTETVNEIFAMIQQTEAVN